MPDLEAVLPDQPLDGESALTLFVQVARRVQYSFRLTAANALDVGRICRLVGGMPLAIQLAASWVALLSPAEIAAEIAADLRFLSTSRRDLPERHRSLAAVIEPSWRRLSEADQDAFSRLCLCRGGVTRTDAQALTGCSLATLARLQQHAFLQYASDSGRYQIHEVLRQYGAAQLEADPDRRADAQRRPQRALLRLAGGPGRADQHRRAGAGAGGDRCRGRQLPGGLGVGGGGGRHRFAGIRRGCALLLLRVSGAFPGGFRRLPDLSGAMRVWADGRGRSGCRRICWPGRARSAISWVSIRRSHRLLQSSLARLEELAGRGIEVRSELAFTRLRMGELAAWRNTAEAGPILMPASGSTDLWAIPGAPHALWKAWGLAR